MTMIVCNEVGKIAEYSNGQYEAVIHYRHPQYRVTVTKCGVVVETVYARSQAEARQYAFNVVLDMGRI